MSLNDLLVHDRKQTILQDIYIYIYVYVFLFLFNILRAGSVLCSTQ